jgi:hypothetical protein
MYGARDVANFRTYTIDTVIRLIDAARRANWVSGSHRSGGSVLAALQRPPYRSSPANGLRGTKGRGQRDIREDGLVSIKPLSHILGAIG